MEFKPRLRRIESKLKNPETVGLSYKNIKKHSLTFQKAIYQLKEKARKEAWKEGFKEGYNEVFKKRFAIEIARVCLKIGMSVKQVSSCTDLDEDFLEKLKQLDV